MICRKLNVLFLIALTPILLSSCALTNSQYKTSKHFFNSVNEFDKQCSTLEESSAQVTYERRLLYPGSYQNDTLMVNELISNYNDRNNRLYTSDSVDNSIAIIGSYFNGYKSLLSKSYDTKAQDRRVLAAIQDFSSYLPFGIGLTVYKTIYDVINYSMRFVRIPHQRKKMKEYIAKGEDIVPENLNRILEKYSANSTKLDSEKVLIKQNYLLFLQTQRVKKTPSDYYYIYNDLFLKKYNLASSSIELNKAIIQSIPRIKDSYINLYNNTRSRTRLKGDNLELSKMNAKLGKTKMYNLKVEDALVK